MTGSTVICARTKFRRFDKLSAALPLDIGLRALWFYTLQAAGHWFKGLFVSICKPLRAVVEKERFICCEDGTTTMSRLSLDTGSKDF